MMKNPAMPLCVLLLSLLLLVAAGGVSAQEVITISSGVKGEVFIVEKEKTGDSVIVAAPDRDSGKEKMDKKAVEDSLRLYRKSAEFRTADSIRKATQLQSPIFRDTMSISRMTAISFALPGFSQLYNRQAWKIPVIYGVGGGLAYLTSESAKKYKDYRSQYKALKATPGITRAEIDPIQESMIKYNTQRQLFLVGTILTYVYSIGDGALNYPHPVNSVKKATTLSMIFPGAGQMYNGSYWKVPIVIGAFVTMGYVIDFNSRGYTRFKDAYNEYPNDEFSGRYPQSMLKNVRDQYRRNRDLGIILTCGLYVLNIIEAHVDAYMKDFDISNELSVKVEPTMIDMSGVRTSSNYTNSSLPGFGLAMKFTF